MKYFSFLNFVMLILIGFDSLKAQINQPDPSFNTTGFVITPVGQARDEVNNMAVQADGKIIVIGSAYNSTASESSFGLVRYKTNGKLDSSFGVNGKILHTIVTGQNRPYGIALQSDNKIVVAGWVSSTSGEDWGVMRLKPNGVPDSTFGTNGVVMISFGDKTEYPATVAIQNDDKIIIGGFYFLTGVGYQYALARLLPNGNPDNSFHFDGKATAGENGVTYYGYSMVLQDDGKIVMGGTAQDGVSKGGLARFKSNGNLDSTFGTNGFARLPVPVSLSNNIYGIARQPDGKYVLCGSMMNATMDFLVMRSQSNGKPDSSFGINGVKSTDFASKGDRAYFVIVQPDGKILVAGDAYETKFNFAMSRYHSDGSVDSTFGTKGKMMLTAGNYPSQGMVAVLDTGKRILMAGHATISGTNSDFAVYRITNEIKINNLNQALVENTVLVYPNPVKDKIHLEFSLNNDVNLSVELVDLQGRSVYSWMQNKPFAAGAYSENLDVPNNLQGLYLLKLSTPDGLVIIKLQF